MITLIPRRWQHLCVAMAVLLAFSLLPNILYAQDKPIDGKATVTVSALNVREGPGTRFAKVGLVNAGDVLIVKGGFDTCSWLYVETQTNIVGWISGNSRYTRLETPCNELPEIDLKSIQGSISSHDLSVAAAAATATSSPTPSAPAGESTPVPPTTVNAESSAASPEPAATPALQAEFYGTVVPEGKGCIAWGSYVGPDIYVTATHRASREIIENLLPNNTQTVVCYSQGTWDITISVVSNRYHDFSFDIAIAAGDTYDWPFYLQY